MPVDDVSEDQVEVVHSGKQNEWEEVARTVLFDGIVQEVELCAKQKDETTEVVVVIASRLEVFLDIRWQHTTHDEEDRLKHKNRAVEDVSPVSLFSLCRNLLIVWVGVPHFNL